MDLRTCRLTNRHAIDLVKDQVTEVINLNSGKYNKKYINLCIDFIQRINRNSMEALLNSYKKHFKSYED